MVAGFSGHSSRVLRRSLDGRRCPLTAEAVGYGTSGAAGDEGPRLDLKSMRQYFIPCPVPELADFIDNSMEALRENILRGIEGGVSPGMMRRLRDGDSQLGLFLAALSGALRSGDLEPFLAYQAEQVEGFARDGISLAEVESLADCIREGLMQTLMQTASTPDQMLSFTMSSRILEKFVDATSALTARHYILAREQELTQKEAQLEKLAQRVLAAQEEERQRIGQDIHDELIQLLFGLRYRLDILQGKLDRGDDVEEEIVFIKQRIDEGLSELRRILRNLRPAVLDDLGLVPALSLLVRQLKESAGLEASLSTDDDAIRLPAAAETCLYRVAQEALVNTVKHAGASRVEVSLSVSEDAVKLTVWDNGSGFERGGREGPGDVALRKRERPIGDGIRPTPAQDNYGLYGMQERVRSLNGRLCIESEPGGGTTIIAELSLRNGDGLRP
jgi:signal transduction histidine kinase